MLEPQHTKRIDAASGWLDLGNHVEASKELDALPASLQAHPDVLSLRFAICSCSNNWTEALVIANTLLGASPGEVRYMIYRSVALHESNRTQEAYDWLLPALKMPPGDWLVPYNLTIYLCKLGRIDEALDMLPLAFRFGDAEKVKRIVLDDPDFKPLWERIGELMEKSK